MRIWAAGLGCVVLVGVPAVYFLSRRADDRLAVHESAGAPADTAGASARARSTTAWMPPSSPMPVPNNAAQAPQGTSSDAGASAIAAAQEDAPGPLLERDRQIEAMRLSGPDSEGLLAATGAARKAWNAFTAGAGQHVEAAPWECHRAGCFSTAVHASMQSVEEATSRILAAEEIAAWPGSKMRSAPIVRPDGKVEVTWIFGAPHDAGTTATAAATP
jgi:hypothetical protein